MSKRFVPAKLEDLKAMKLRKQGLVEDYRHPEIVQRRI